MRYSVILPTLNERLNLEKMVSDLLALNLDELEILVVDEHSSDGTFELAKQLETEKPGRIFAMLNPGPKCLSASVIAGFKSAHGEYLFCMDADGQHRPCDLPKLITALQAGADIAVGSRYAQGGGFAMKWNFFRSLMSWTAARMAFLVLGVSVRDPMSGFFGIRRSSFEKVKEALSPKGFKILLELLFLLHFLPETTVQECGITFCLREKGKSKLSGRVILGYLQMLWTCRKNRRRLRDIVQQSAGVFPATR